MRKKGSAGKRVVIRLNSVLDQRLLSYAAAASAAGVGVLAIAQSAEAKVVYTPANVAIVPNQVLPLDLNNDGAKDFFFFLSMIGGDCCQTGTLSVDPVRPNNRILGNKLYASALQSGVTVGPGGQFQQEHDFMAAAGIFLSGGYSSRGPWTGTLDRYLGFKFFIKGVVHYGWASLHVAPKGNISGFNATLSGYAYESDPNTAILTGAVSGNGTGKSLHPQAAPPNASPLANPSLGLLARGYVGIPDWRSKIQTNAGK
jgi:hypothetical protein